MTRITHARGPAICAWLGAMALLAIAQESAPSPQPESGPDLRTRVEAQLRLDAAHRVDAASAERALDLLRSAREATEDQRALALIALGIARHTPARELLESQARYGPGFERIAAIAALGDLGSPDSALFAELVRDPDRIVRGMACLALDLGGAGSRVVELAAAGSAELAASARAALDFAREPHEHLDFHPGVLRLVLRARAAAAYGPVPESLAPPEPAATGQSDTPTAPVAPAAPESPPSTTGALNPEA
ncbi:MAG: hypothetical protein FJ299_13395, partial [Planctomycetes bacterium]|nr:hypothetical protein [Planctomycetota bacterium]